MKAAMDIPVVLARAALAKTDAAACNRGWDDLVARYGYDEAARAWRQACNEMDTAAEGTP